LDELDVLVHCSVIPEPFGQAVLEGMAAGLPVIASGAGGPAELIASGVDGILATTGHADEIATALRQLQSDRQLLRRTSSRSGRRDATSSRLAVTKFAQTVTVLCGVY
jgi:glycosyltransferase involved in cell wall biosynthesis